MWTNLQECQTPVSGLYASNAMAHVLEGANIDFAFMELEGWGDPGPTVALDA